MSIMPQGIVFVKPRTQNEKMRHKLKDLLKTLGKINNTEPKTSSQTWENAFLVYDEKEADYVQLWAAELVRVKIKPRKPEVGGKI